MKERHDLYDMRDGVDRCLYCGSVRWEFFLKADSVIDTDKKNKFYIIKDGKQYKFYADHL